MAEKPTNKLPKIEGNENEKSCCKFGWHWWCRLLKVQPKVKPKVQLESSEKGITIPADNDDEEDADMENTAKAEKDGIKTGLSPTEKTAMEASRAAMQARLKEAEDKWSVQVSKFNNALDEEKTTCAAAKAAALAAQALEKRKKELQSKLLNMEKMGAKSRERPLK